MHMHRRIAEALEQLYVADLERHAGPLAHHLLESAPLGRVDKAVEFAPLAARQASDRLAYEDAALLYERALDALELSDDDERPRRLDLLLELRGAATPRVRAARDA